MAQSPVHYSRSYSGSISHSHSQSHAHSQPQSQTQSPSHFDSSRSPSRASVAHLSSGAADPSLSAAAAAAAAAAPHNSMHQPHPYHQAHHHRQHHGSMSSSASLSSVDLRSRSGSHTKEGDRAHSRGAELPAASDVVQASAAQMHDTHSNVQSHSRPHAGGEVGDYSAPPSHFPSRRGSGHAAYAGSSVASSMYPSAMHSLAPSGATTQYASPMSKSEADLDAQGHGQGRRDAAGGSLAGPTQPTGSYHYVDSLASGEQAGHHRTDSQGDDGHMSMGNLSLFHSSSGESLDGGAGHSYQPARPRVRPVHFTFTQEHVIKSLLKAAERDRQRAEREAEKAREAQQRAAMERERDAARAQKIYQHQREMQAREEAYKLSLRRAELERQRERQGARDTSSSDSDSEDYDSSYSDPPSLGDYRVRSPLRPVHFKFDSHDIRKSYSKPSQRQQIGHWTTFPRSSTVMYPGAQLRAWIANLQRMRIEGERQFQSAPASPLAQDSAAARHTSHSHHPQDAIRQQLGDSSGSLLGKKGTQLQSRRSSLPLSQSQLGHVLHSHSSSSGATMVPLDAKQVVQQLRNQPSRLTHTRSRTLSDVPRDDSDAPTTATAAGAAHSYEHDKSKYATPSADQKLSSRGVTTDGGEKNTGIRRSGVHSRRSSAGSVEMSRVGLHEHRAAPVKAVPLGGIQAAAASGTGGMDASSRRSQLLNQQRANMTLHSSAASSASSSAHPSPTRSAVQPSQSYYVQAHPQPQARPHYASARPGASTHVSPSRRERAMRTAVARSATLPAAASASSSHAYLPPQQHPYPMAAGTVSASSRRVTYGHDSKVGSAGSSPLPGSRSVAGADAAWPPPPPPLPAVYAQTSHHKGDALDSWQAMAQSGQKMLGTHASPLYSHDAATAAYHGPKSTVPIANHSYQQR